MTGIRNRKVPELQWSNIRNYSNWTSVSRTLGFMTSEAFQLLGLPKLWTLKQLNSGNRSSRTSEPVELAIFEPLRTVWTLRTLRAPRIKFIKNVSSRSVLYDSGFVFYFPIPQFIIRLPTVSPTVAIVLRVHASFRVSYYAEKHPESETHCTVDTLIEYCDLIFHYLRRILQSWRTKIKVNPWINFHDFRVFSRNDTATLRIVR